MQYHLWSFKTTGWRRNCCDPRSPNSIMKSIIRMIRKWLSAKETAKGAPFQSCFLFRMFYVLLIKCGMTFVLAGYLSTLDDVTPTRVGHWLKSWGLLGPTDYFTNLGGGRDGIFLITRHSNVMFSLEVTPPPPQLMLSWKISSVFFSIFV